ncbi:MAG TPA: hypothetical protein VFR17_01495 [Mycobacterium sp.]|nr:hypothetical protein [Mycobacterium sp.]
MDTKNGRPVQRDARPSDFARAVRQLRAAAAGTGQTEAQRQWIRAATQC